MIIGFVLIVILLFETDSSYLPCTDNGGAYAHGADNSPLRGSKGNYREGGIRVVSFVTSPLIPPAARGTIYRGLMGAADWLPTLVDGVAGGSTKYLAVDGINMWNNIR